MKKSLIIFCLLCVSIVFAQVVTKDSLVAETPVALDSMTTQSSKSEVQILEDIKVSNANPKTITYSPTKAGLYSAVLPGLGQYYNKKYWKIPIVWGAIGTGVGITIWNDNWYKRYRDAFVAELNGLPHEFSERQGYTKEALGRAQDRMKRQRDYAIAITSLVYILGIMDAVVDAHLYQQRNDPDLAIRPAIIYDQFATQPPTAGLSLNFKF
ncbi:MAG: DUF5683 domain-containing protein [Cruoricaptor ignavus]|nr:DUF5683 domain-containing protein [Cruoricaptor ignavus]